MSVQTRNLQGFKFTKSKLFKDFKINCKIFFKVFVIQKTSKLYVLVKVFYVQVYKQ